MFLRKETIEDGFSLERCLFRCGHEEADRDGSIQHRDDTSQPQILETTSSVKAVGVKKGQASREKKNTKGGKKKQQQHQRRHSPESHQNKTFLSSSAQRFIQAVDLRMVCRGQH